MTNISVVEGAVWRINRPIDITFDRAVDFSTVNMNTVQLVSTVGVSATGVFLQPLDNSGNVRTNVVRFQPNCPTEDDFSDSGLAVNASYQLRLPGTEGSGNVITLRSMNNEPLAQGHVVNFTTPDSNLPAVLFLDTVPGPPAVRVRGLAGIGAAETEATYLEVGGDTNNRVYFSQGGLGTYSVPLNLYSDVSTQVAVMLFLNQPVLADSANVSPDRVRLEYFDDNTTSWVVVPTAVSLADNCVESGSIVRLEPLGILPQGANLRVNLRQGFVDLTGDPTPQDNNSFAMMEVDLADDGSNNPVDTADEVLEEFLLSGSAEGSLEDTSTPLGSPRAMWANNGKLTASFNFGGSGGPNGDFDYYVPAGEDVSINTVTASIIGGPDGAPVTSQTVINGVMDVRNLYVPAGSRLIFVGNNPATILASGWVRIEGEIVINGGNSDGVGSLNTTFMPEGGAPGNAGGGRGGTGSFLTSSNTPRGGAGYGAFNQAGRGGQGGETTYKSGSNVDFRRGAGGGGGALGEDVMFDHDSNAATPDRHCQTLIGMDGENGFAGAAQGTGAVSQSQRALGGDLGPKPFFDTRADNNFYGTLITAAGELIEGELNRVWAGAGGGGGGDASNSAVFPQPTFQPGGDEKGAGGGGGAGGIAILAIGPITIENGGFILANGGYGGGGESTNFYDRIGGGSGGGSGGHIVLSSASYVEIQGIAAGAGDEYRDGNAGHQLRPISALGGQGGAGADDRGGASLTGNTQWRCDAIPKSRVLANGTSPAVPPADLPSACWTQMPNQNDTEVGAPVNGAGGDGSPGILQIHVDDPASNLRFTGISPTATWGNADVSKATVPPPYGYHGPTAATDDFVAFFGRLSVAQSDWIPLGLARIAPGANPDDQVRFFFDGIDPLTGAVLRSGGGTGSSVAPLADVIAATTLQSVGTAPYVESAGFAAVLDGAGLDAAYKANPALLRNFSLVLTDSAHSKGYPVTGASIDANELVRLTVATNLVDDFLNTAQGAVSAALRPNFFRVSSQGQLDSYPLGTEVAISFDAAMLGADGLPDEATSFSAVNGDLTSDVTDLNGQNWDLVRFRVVFDLNTGGGGVNPTAPRPSLEFIRLPFIF
ncbi:MAG: hypothetical protein R3F33_13800 [Planctomycetota bacterium]